MVSREQIVTVVDYGMGNIRSLSAAVSALGYEPYVTGNPNVISTASTIVLPGVGSFPAAMERIRENGIDTALAEATRSGRSKILGICLGMQLIFEKGSEPHECDGLGWIKGEVKKLDLDGLKIPHMGWNDIEVQNNKFYSKINNFDFYFIHSYHVLPTFKSEIAATVNYGIDIVASIQKDNIFATQFHPEKSQQSGLCLLKEFFEIIC